MELIGSRVSVCAARRAAFGFAAGGILVMLVQIVLPWPPALLDFRSRAFLVAFVLDGALGGWRLARGWRATATFAAGFLAAGWATAGVLTYLGLLSGGESLPGALLYCSLRLALGFGLAGAVGALGLPGRPVGRSTSGFALGGLVGGFIMLLPLLLPWPGEWISLRQAARPLAIVLGFLAPHYLGGAWLGLGLEDGAR